MEKIKDKYEFLKHSIDFLNFCIIILNNGRYFVTQKNFMVKSEVITMEDMIQKIIELDRKASEGLTKANQQRIDLEKKISDIKEQKRSEYLSKATANMEALEKKEKVKAVVRLKVIENSYNRKRERIEDVYSKNRQNWVDTIVQRVIQT